MGNPDWVERQGKRLRSEVVQAPPLGTASEEKSAGDEIDVDRPPGPGSGRDGARTTRAWVERRPFLNAHGLPCASLKRAGPGGLRLRHLKRHPRISPPIPGWMLFSSLLGFQKAAFDAIALPEGW